jgi:transposase
MARKGKAKKTDGAVLPVMRPHAAGIDIGATEIFVAVPVDRAAEYVRSFPTFTQDLYALADGAFQIMSGLD